MDSEVKVSEKPNKFLPSPSTKIVKISTIGKKNGLQKFQLRTSISKPNIVQPVNKDKMIAVPKMDVLKSSTQTVVKTMNQFVDDLPANSVATVTDVVVRRNSKNDRPHCRLRASGNESENGKVMSVAAVVVPWEELTKTSQEQKSFGVTSSSLVSDGVEKSILFDSTKGGPSSASKRKVTISNDISNRIQSLTKNAGIFRAIRDFGNDKSNTINPSSKDVPTCLPAEHDGTRMDIDVDGVVVTLISDPDDQNLLVT
ncbi:Hypothetical protein CINCED_3A002847 [Cinara cedri]|uniref:Uncharacterized protein n=1 Tax=Cinara cedri TaxID=506608 RepID=A0A5E4N900_9HEMI|nr:Hypothetical protein CINCED_3A002847 [Cinara cedri]